MSSRAAMGSAAVKAAKAASYENAGTIEFLLDKNDHFLFYGNEHKNTGGASGNGVGDGAGFDQGTDPYRLRAAVICNSKDIQLNGHAIECRINAEDRSTISGRVRERLPMYIFPGARESA